MKNIIFLILTLSLTTAFAAGVEQKWPTDSAKLGIGSSSATKTLTFDTNDGASNPKLTIPMATKDFNFNKAVKIANDLLRVGNGADSGQKVIEFDLGLGVANPKMQYNSVTDAYEFLSGTLDVKGNLISVGDGTNTTKTIKFNKGASSPEIRYNAATSKLEFTNDAVVYKAIGSGSGSGSGINLIDNKGFEDGISVGWTNVGGTYAAAIAPNILFENVSVAFTASATGQYFESNAVTVPEILKGQNCMAKIQYRGADANAYLTVMDGASAEIIPTNARVTLAPSILKRDAKVYFNCPQSGSVKFRVQSTAAMAVGYFDEAHLGQSDEVPYKQSQIFGKSRWAAATNCVWTLNQTGVGLGGSFLTANSDSDCATPTRTGNAIAITPNLPWIRFANAPAGEYKVTINGVFTIDANSGYLSIWDGSSVGSSRTGLISTASLFGGNTMTSTFRYTSAQSNLTFQPVINIAAGSPNATINNSENTQDETAYEIIVEYYPLESDLVSNARCVNPIDCENNFGALMVVPSGNISGENLDWINGACTKNSTGNFTCNFNSGVFTTTPNCSILAAGGLGTAASVVNTTPTNINFVTFVSNTGVVGDAPVYLNCQKGSDFKPKQEIKGFFSSMLAPVGFSARQSSGQSIPSAVATTLIMSNENYDSHNSHDTSTGVYSVPETGKYLCTCRYSYASFTPANNTLSAQIVKNGVLASETLYTVLNIANAYTQSTTFNDSLVFGDQIRCAAFQNTGSAKSIAANTVYNEFSCNKVGN